MRYEYGKEYETNGEKPHLPDDVMVEFFGSIHKVWKPADEVGVWDWDVSIKFRVVDERYEPKSDSITDEGSKWHERGDLPPVGSTVRFNKNRTYTTEGFPFGLWEYGDELEVLAHKEGEVSQVAVVWNSAHQQACGIIPECLQPLQTERDKLHSAGMKVMQDNGTFVYSKQVDAFLDAGWRPVKQQTKVAFCDQMWEEHYIYTDAAESLYRAGCRFIEEGE